MKKKTVRDLDDAHVRGKRVLVRVDFNVPLDENGQITDDTRIRASLPTVKYLLEHGAAVILMSHLGRPKGGPNPKYSLKPAATRLQELLGNSVPVKFANDCIGPEAHEAVVGAQWSEAKSRAPLQPGQVLLLENLRFHPEEEANDTNFAK